MTRRRTERQRPECRSLRARRVIPVRLFAFGRALGRPSGQDTTVGEASRTRRSRCRFRRAFPADVRVPPAGRKVLRHGGGESGIFGSLPQRPRTRTRRRGGCGAPRSFRRTHMPWRPLTQRLVASDFALKRGTNPGGHELRVKLRTDESTFDAGAGSKFISILITKCLYCENLYL